MTVGGSGAFVTVLSWNRGTAEREAAVQRAALSTSEAIKIGVATASGAELADSGRLSVSDTGMPTTAEGLPDFAFVVSTGGSVRGAIPPDGSPMVQHVNQYGSVVEYAAVVDLGHGSPAFYMSGGEVRASSGASGEDRDQLLSIWRNVMAKLPTTLEQALAWSTSNNWPTFEKTTGPIPRSLDAIA